MNKTATEDEEDSKGKVEPYMYFIRNGRYTVHVRTSFITKTTVSIDSEENTNE